MDEAANEEVMRINREVLRILDEYWSKPDNLGPEVWAEIEKAMADPCGHLEEISRLRAENDKANKGLERAGEIETTLRAGLREADEREARWQDTFAEEMAHTMEQYEALGLDTEAVKERPIHELMMGRIAVLREAEARTKKLDGYLEQTDKRMEEVIFTYEEVARKLAESQARAARMEAKGQDLRDSLVKIRCADCAEHGYTPEKMDCPVCAEGMRRIWDWYAALSPGTALEAVNKALGRLRDIQAMSPDMNARADAAEAERELRNAFGLAGEGGER